ncbi:MAG: insulinase family protein [Verrucomicrobiae bacterium]|nr:insulinase family protein [Verrucomicrobiae bacterium]
MSEETEALHFPSFEARVETLSNGLEILVREDRSAPVVSLQAWVRTGSIHEGSWLGAGISHFLEHMLFKGTGSRNASEIAQAVQAKGGYINAYTSFDRTVYWIDAPTAGAMECLEVLCEVVGDAMLPEEEFENESEVIRREIAMGEDNPEQVLSKLFFRTAYAVHPCRQPVIGHLDLFNQLRRDDLHTYYHERYSPDNVFFVVVGDVDPDEVVKRIGEKLGGLSRRKRPPVFLPAEPPQLGPREGSVTFPTELHRERLSWQVPDGSHPDVPALDLLAAILGDGRSSRLFQSVREKQHLAHAVGAWSYTPSFAGQFALSFDTESEKAGAARTAVLAELSRLCEEGVNDREVEKSRRQILSAQFATFTDMRGQASDIGSNWLLAHHPDHTRDYVEAIQHVGAEAIREVAQRYLQPGSMSTVALLPKAASRVAGRTVAAKRSEDIRRIVLPNGLTVLLLQDHRVPFVQATGVFRGGLLGETETTAGATRVMSRLFTKDTRKRSAEELALEIESVGGGIGSSTGNNSFGVSVHALRPDLERVVDLLGEALLEPAFLPEVVEREKAYQLSQIKAESDRPFSVAMKALRRRLYGAHPYGLEASGTVESISAIDREGLVDRHGRLLVGGNGVVGVFGDLDLDRAEAMVRSRFELPLLPGPRMFESGDIPLPPPDAGIVELKHEKEQAVLLIGYRTVDLLHPDNPDLEMIDEACSDMASRLFIRIREELGLAYSVGASRLAGLAPGFLVFYASTSPEKLDLVQQEMLSEIDLIVREGLEKEEFDRAKASWIGREAIHLQGVRELASTAAVDELVGLGWDHYRKTPETVAALTREEVREAAERHLREDNRVIVRLTR